MKTPLTIHDDIESWLAAEAHDQLSVSEREALHRHLVECLACRQLHREEKNMHKLLEENLSTEKADPAFEHRMLASFRQRVPDQRGHFAAFVIHAFRLRATQIAAAAVILLALLQTGRMLTHEGNDTTENRLLSTEVAAAAAPQNAPVLDSLGKTASRSTGKPAALAEARSKDQTAAPPPVALMESRSNTQSEADSAAPADGMISKTEQVAQSPASAATDQRKVVRSARVELEVASFNDSLQQIVDLAKANGGYVATSNSQKQANGKLQGEIVVKVLPDKLDAFLLSIRSLGELKNQSLGSEDVTKSYFDTEARLKNARVMEQRLLDMLKTKTGKVSDLLQVEKELARVREEIERMQGELKYWDAQVQLATVTVSLAEKNLEQPAAFLLKERSELALYSPRVETVYNQIKALVSPKVQISSAQLGRDNRGNVTAQVHMLLAPEESDAVITRIKSFGQVENFQVETERVAQGGEGMSQNARTKRDKVELTVTLSREEQEQAAQQTTLQIRTTEVDKKTAQLRDLVEKQSGRIRTSSFSRDPDGHEIENVLLRVPMKNYQALMGALESLGKVENVAVQREDRAGDQSEMANAPADLSIQIYSQGSIVSSNTGLIATLRHTLGQGAEALMWSLRMIGVAIAFVAPWAIALALIIWIVRLIARRRR
ncbi:MAG TPA: DUF4349 domain-containing protein [Chthoniobacterales bacterium]|jgi:hypothetical protein